MKVSDFIGFAVFYADIGGSMQTTAARKHLKSI